MHVAVTVDSVCGWGHAVRMEALVTEIISRGHKPTPVNTTKPRRGKYDWLIIDAPSVPKWVWQWQKSGIKVALLNGVGLDVAEKRADLVIVQGLPPKGKKLPPNTVAGKEYVIIRQTLAQFGRKVGHRDVVFGGAKDALGLLTHYTTTMTEQPAFLLSTRDGPPVRPAGMFHHLRRLEGDEFLGYLAIAKRAIIAMGMTAWECAYLGVPTYAFSLTKTHLQFAKEMERAGFLRAYPQVGLPETGEQLEAFLGKHPILGGSPPDLLGAERIVKALEGLS